MTARKLKYLMCNAEKGKKAEERRAAKKKYNEKRKKGAEEQKAGVDLGLVVANGGTDQEIQDLKAASQMEVNAKKRQQRSTDKIRVLVEKKGRCSRSCLVDGSPTEQRMLDDQEKAPVEEQKDEEPWAPRVLGPAKGEQLNQRKRKRVMRKCRAKAAEYQRRKRTPGFRRFGAGDDLKKSLLYWKHCLVKKFGESIKKAKKRLQQIDSDTIAVTFWRDFSTDALLVEGSSVKLTNLKIIQSNYHNKVDVKLQTLPHSTISASTRTFPKLSLHSIKDFSKTYDIVEFFPQTFKPYTGCRTPTCNLKHVHYVKSRALHQCPICNLDWKIKDLHWAPTIRLGVRETGSNTAERTECLCFTESLLLLADLKLVSWFEGKMYETVISEIFCFNNYTVKGELCCKEKEKYFTIRDVVQKTLIA